MSENEQNEPVDTKSLEHIEFPGIDPKLLGRCNCGEGKRYALFYLKNSLHRKCRTCGEIVNLEK